MTSPTAPHDLSAAADTILQTALQSEHGRHAELLVLDGHLRQTVIALTSGSRLSDHNAPPAATIQVLRGAIEVTTDSGSSARLSQGQLDQLTKERHGVMAMEDSVFLLTTVTGVEEGSHG
ncbi:cupin [Ornithinimicrobium pratense]|uniref:Cupin n=1 Tax=Ornithinimicrobium pratense TaxID=2593973 RepID=A0A5J6V5Y2_9MICO|nr:cupin [Ornithinimicrobium pratense]QFG68432.1 cupin [Ornithinimicrobium pratense]